MDTVFKDFVVECMGCHTVITGEPHWDHGMAFCTPGCALSPGPTMREELIPIQTLLHPLEEDES